MSDKDKDEDKFNKRVDKTMGPFEYIARKELFGIPFKLNLPGTNITLVEEFKIGPKDETRRRQEFLSGAKDFDELLREIKIPGEDKTMCDVLLSVCKTLYSAGEGARELIKEILKNESEDTDVTFTLPGTNIDIGTVKFKVPRMLAEKKFNSKVDNKTDKVKTKKQNNKISDIARQKTITSKGR